MITIELEEEVIQSEILLICLERGGFKSCCPSEVARKLYPTNWRDKMDFIRQQAQILNEKGYIKITQKRVPVKAHQKGPIRLSWNN
jgi:hypothetical protein